MPQIAIIWAIWDRSKWKAKSLLISYRGLGQMYQHLAVTATCWRLSQPSHTSPPPSPPLSAAYDNSVIVCRRSIAVPPSSAATPLAAAAIVHHCSTLPPIACHSQLPPSPDAVICQLSSQPSSTAAAIVRRNRRLVYVPIPIVKFIQSTYEGPRYKKLGMAQILRREQRKRDPEAMVTEPDLLCRD